MRLFFATDIHGSERCFMKFVNAAKAYRVDCVVMGGDITGKLLVPIVAEPDGTFTADIFGTTRTVRGDGVIELKKTLRQSGSYTVDLTRAAKDALDREPEQVPEVFARAITETLTRWFSVAQERLEPAGIPVSSARATTTRPTSTPFSPPPGTFIARRGRSSSCRVAMRWSAAASRTRPRSTPTASCRRTSLRPGW